MPRFEIGPSCGRWSLTAVSIGLCLLFACSREANAAPDDPAPDKVIKGTKAGEERTFSYLKMKFCWCPAGKFTMGSPNTEADRNDDNERQVEVTLQGFWMGKYEVMQAEYERVMSNNPSHFKGNQLPVETVSREDATKFCEKLTEMERTAGRLPKSWKYSLPTEAQWEYACRVGTTTAYCFGDDPQQLGDYAWYRDNAEGKTHDVGQKKANAWGLHDMHGNVWEWCQDWGGVYPSGAVTDPTGAALGSSRVSRGGSWYVTAGYCRSSFRYWSGPSFRFSILGFRVATVPYSQPSQQPASGAESGSR